MKWFYRMRLGQINSRIFVAVMLLLIVISAILVRVWQDFDIDKLDAFAVCVGGTVLLALLNHCSYSNSVDGKHSIRMKVYLDSDGMRCMDKEHRIWSCNWNEIHHLERRFNIHRCRSVYVYLYEEEEKPFYFEYSRSAKKALLEACPREDLLDQLRKPELMTRAGKTTYD